MAAQKRDRNKDGEGSKSSMSNDAAARWPDLETGATAARSIHATLPANCCLMMALFLAAPSAQLEACCDFSKTRDGEENTRLARPTSKKYNSSLLEQSKG